MLHYKVLLIGNGHVGKYLKDYWELPDSSHWKEPMQEIMECDLDSFKPDVVVNTAAKTNLMWCQSNIHQTMMNNAVYPFRLGKLCDDRKIPFIHLSSGCVWRGPYKPDNTPFYPNDVVNPACIYTYSKAIGDELLQDLDSAIVLRPRLVYSHFENQRNLLKKLSIYKQLLNTPNSITSIRTIAKTVEGIMSVKSSPKILNVYDKGVITPLQIGTYLHIRGLRDMPEILERKNFNDYERVDVVMYDPVFEELVNPPNVYEELNYMIAEYKKVNNL